MSRYELGCCGAIVRFLLIVVNFLFLLMGIVVFIMSVVLKWSSLLENITNQTDMATLARFDALKGVCMFLLFVSVFAILLSLFGLIGVSRLNRFCLVIYGLTLMVLFLAHGISIVLLLSRSKSFERAYRKALNRTVDDINSNTADAGVKCDVMRNISLLFGCCGVRSAHDFTNASMICCANNTLNDDGCGDVAVNLVRKNAVDFLFIPSAIILIIELFGIVMVPFLIGLARSLNKQPSQQYLMPTNQPRYI